MGFSRLRKQRQKKFEKMMKRQVKAKAPVLCPKHGTPYEVEYSKNPTTEGACKHFFCLKCRADTKP